MSAQRQEPVTFKWQPRRDPTIRDYSISFAVILALVSLVALAVASVEREDHGYIGYQATPVEVGR